MADYTGSNIPSQGLVRDLGVLGGGYDSADFAYRLQAHQPESIEVGVYVDGDLAGRQGYSQTQGSVAGLSPGDHSLELIPLAAGQRREGYGSAQGSRVYLRWPASDSADTAAYGIYKGGALLGTVSERIVYPLDHYRTASGGRVSVSGSPGNGETVNGVFAVTCASGVATFEGLPYTIQRGVTSSLPFGIRVTWHDDPWEYTGSFDVRAGIRNDFTTGNLEPGTHEFEVRGADAAGNESLALARSVKVISYPPAAAITDNIVTMPVQAADRINIYSDYNAALGVHDEHIETRLPSLSLVYDPLEDNYGEADLPVGTRYYARPVIGNTEREDLAVHTVIDPLAPVLTFGITGDLALAPAAGGDMLFSFNYRPDEEGDSATGFRVDYGVAQDQLTSEEAAMLSQGRGVAVKAFEVLLPTGSATGTVWFARVTPLAGAAEGEASETISAAADADAPVMTGMLGGLAT